MATEKKNFLTQLAMVFRRLSAARKISMLLLIGGAVFGCVMLMTWASQPDFGVLYADLEPEDAGAILSALKDDKIPYEIHGNGSSVMVPREKIAETRLELASRGLPRGNAVGFELFDNTKLGMTEFAQNVNYQRAMQGELARTINGFAEVESSRVHLVMQPKSLFIENEKPATASVVLKLRRGKWLNTNQVDGIVHLVSSSIMGLSPENVTVVDDRGKMLSGINDETGIKQVGTFQLEYRDKIERNLENRITTMLEKALGQGNAMVRVSCAVNFKKQEKTEELYYPENQVVRSEKLFQTANDSDAKQNPAGQPGPGAKFTPNWVDAEKAGSQTVFEKQDRTVNYEIGKVTSRTVEPVGRVEKISVAVLVDGTYALAEDQAEETAPKYVPRSAEELSKIENIVKSAITYDKERGDQVSVVNMPFDAALIEHVEAEKKEAGWMDSIRKTVGPAVKYIFALVATLLVYLFLLRPVVQWVTATDVSDAQLLQQLPKTVGELEREFDRGGGALAYNNGSAGLLSGNNEKAVQLLRNWMNQK